jgi:hypothetical protein
LEFSLALIAPLGRIVGIVSQERRQFFADATRFECDGRICSPVPLSWLSADKADAKAALLAVERVRSFVQIKLSL